MLISAIILSSGFSKRMGAFKPLLMYKDNTFSTEIIKKLELVCSSVIFVTGFRSGVLIEELEHNNIFNSGKIIPIYNPDFEQGMFTSLQAGLKQLPETDWAIIHMIDQPDLPSEFYKEFIQEFDDQFHWIQPSFNRRKGHPVAISFKLFNKILTAPKDSTLRTLFVEDNINKKIWECNYSQVLSDIDTPEDYQSLLKRQE